MQKLKNADVPSITKSRQLKEQIEILEGQMALNQENIGKLAAELVKKDDVILGLQRQLDNQGKEKVCHITISPGMPIDVVLGGGLWNNGDLKHIYRPLLRAVREQKRPTGPATLPIMVKD